MKTGTLTPFCPQVEQKGSCEDYLSLIYLSIDAVTEGLLLSEPRDCDAILTRVAEQLKGLTVKKSQQPHAFLYRSLCYPLQM